MDILDIKKALEILSKEGLKPINYTLIFSRAVWECSNSKANGYTFSKEELDAAEKSDVKLIGIRNGVKCYLPTLFNP
jgi:uncharacterized linocin/CFP29 family protein